MPTDSELFEVNLPAWQAYGELIFPMDGKIADGKLTNRGSKARSLQMIPRSLPQGLLRMMGLTLVGCALWFFHGCALPGLESSSLTTPNSLQKKAIIEAVEKFLSVRNCSGAISTILPVYDSVNTDNVIRMGTAKAYACSAGIGFLSLLGDLTAFSGDLGGSGFWEFLTQEFPSQSDPDDRKLIAAEKALDAIQAVIKPGAILIPSLTLYSTSNNPASLLVADRTDDANSFLATIGMSLMGILLNRYGAPLPNYHKSTSLPWVTPTTVTADGCAFAAGLLNFYDGIQFIIDNAPSSMASKFGTIQTMLGTVVTVGCTVSCQLAGCAATECESCPTTLRDRNSCTFLLTDPNSCAAAGLAINVNASWSGPP